jgi:hypothetical protein
MSKFQKKYNFNAKGILYVEDGVISVENEETGALVNIPEHLGDFIGKECTLSVAYAEDVE